MNAGARNAAAPAPGAREQAVLPTRVAFELCVTGLRTRLGRSLITLAGVGLGIAFLSSVLTGFHLRDAMQAEAEARREAVRWLGLLRAEVGRLDGRRYRVHGAGDDRHARLTRLLERRRGEIVAGPPADVAILLPGAAVDDGALRELAAHPDTLVLLLGDPDPALAARLEAAGLAAHLLGLEPDAGGPDGGGGSDGEPEQARRRLLWIVGFSLLITVVNVTNAMLMSVTERFREIATMKCLGSLSGFVVKLFLIESAIIGAAGSVAGALLGVVVPMIVYAAMYGLDRLGGSVDLLLLAGFGFGCVLIGTALAIVSGIYPARVAARMVPAAALRSHI